MSGRNLDHVLAPAGTVTGSAFASFVSFSIKKLGPFQRSVNLWKVKPAQARMTVIVHFIYSGRSHSSPLAEPVVITIGVSNSLNDSFLSHQDRHGQHSIERYAGRRLGIVSRATLVST